MNLIGVMKFVKRGASRGRTWLQENGLPYSDHIELLPCEKEFPDGGHYGINIPVITSLKLLEFTAKELGKAGVETVQLAQTTGSHLMCDSEIKEMLSACAEYGHGIIFGIGTRPEFDIKASFYRSEYGLEQGRRLNNNDAIACAVDEALKLADFGCTNIAVYDLGLLRIFSKMRSEGALPKDVLFTVSSHCSISNSATAEVFAENGADMIVPLHDVGLPVLQEMRKVLSNKIALCIPLDMYKAKGGFIRFYEIPDIVQIASPVFLKFGASAQADPYDSVGDAVAKKRIERVIVGLEHLNMENLPVSPLSKTSPYWGVPRM